MNISSEQLLLASKVFTSEDQEAFAEFSGDFNPIHMDAVFARRTISGQCVVHGIHGLMWALESLMLKTKLSPSSIEVTFSKPIFLGEELNCFYDKKTNQLIVNKGSLILFEISLKFDSIVHPSSHDLKVRKPLKFPVDRDVNDLEILQSQEFFYRGDQNLAFKLFPNISEKYCKNVCCELASISEIIGMHAPGLHSLLLSAKIDFQISKEVPNFAIKDLHKKFKLLTILLIQGGIHLKALSFKEYYNVLESLMNNYVNVKKNTIIFINHQSGSLQEMELGLLASKFSPILNSKSYTYVLDDYNNSLKGDALSKNWRHNLKRALNNPKLTYHSIVKLEERKRAFGDLRKFYNNLRSRKNFQSAINLDLSKDLIIENSDFRIIEARLENKVIAIRIGFFSKNNVLDFLAASDVLATKTYANYLLLYKLIEISHLEGKSYFDCGGINPSENMGVFNFKKGLGGRLNINGPIWLNASGSFIKKIVRLLYSLTN